MAESRGVCSKPTLIPMIPEASSNGDGGTNKKRSRRVKGKAHKKTQSVPPWRALRSLFSCRYQQDVAVGSSKKKSKMVGLSRVLCSSTRDSTDVVVTRPEAAATPDAAPSLVAHSHENSASLSPGSFASAAPSSSSTSSSSSSSTVSSFGAPSRGMHLRRLSGCCECHVLVNGQSTDPSVMARVCPCLHCGEVFMKPAALELHQSVRHAVSELGPEDTSRNIIEIIFQSSWLTRQTATCKVDRILKIHNSKRTLTRFEEYRDSIKSTANKLPRKHPRCIADGNELLRFYCTTLECSLGLNGSTSLCQSIPQCKACSIIRDGFSADESGKIQTMATSGRAHDVALQVSSGEEKMAMLLCRVIAGRVRRSQDALVEEYDSAAGGSAGNGSNLDELFVFSPKAILPCFVVVYRNM